MLSNCHKEIDIKIDYEKYENERLKMEVELLRKEYSELKNTSEKQTAALRALEKKIEMECKLSMRLKTLLAKAHYKMNNMEEKLLGIFTEGQIKKLKAGDKRTTWTKEDITQAITLYESNSKLYKLLYKKKFPLPAIRTLQLWRQKNHISTSTLEPSIQASFLLKLMKSKNSI